MENGMDDFIAKPIEMTELNRVLKEYVQSKAPEGYFGKTRGASRHQSQKGPISRRPGPDQPPW